MIFLDAAATTPVRREVLEAMWPYLTGEFGNPSSHHSLGEAAATALAGARAATAKALGCRPGEVVFTSGGTEADNLAVKGIALARRAADPHLDRVAISAVEHPAVEESARYLERVHGFAVDVVPVDRYGQVTEEAFAAVLRPETALASVMYANNEVGTVQPIAAIGAVCRAAGVLFHTDAVQAGGALDLNVDRLGVDLLAMSAHKFYGPKGVGFLYVRTGTNLLPQQDGGGQEAKRRSGTENVPGIVGLATALTRAAALAPTDVPRITALRDTLIAGIQREIPDAHLQGHPTERLPNNVAFCFGGVTGEDLLLRLDLAGICASSGSACHSGSPSISHVLEALGTPHALGRGSLRLTLGHENTPADVEYTIATLAAIVRDLRAHAGTYVPGVLALSGG